MKTIPTVLITGLVTGLLFLIGGWRVHLAAYVLLLFAIGMVVWTFKQYDQRHLH